jgi:RNA polymerase sigma factor (sigma-70 family)
MVADVAQLYGALATRLESIVRRDVRAPTVVIEDACQVAWYRLLRHAERVERDAVLSWLAGTAVHEAVKLARRDQRELSLEARADEDGQLNLPDGAPGPHEQVARRERLELVRRLPARQQRPLWLKAIGFSYAEIASETGLTLRSVERQLHNGRKRLRAAV